MGMRMSGDVVRQLGAIYRGGTVAGLGDAELLERVVSRRDGPVAEAAFEAIVVRHGPMVLAACRRALPDPGDAEDAFQATFLVLARKARSVRVKDGSLGPWLRGVARKVATRARRQAGRRRDAGGAIAPEVVSTASGPIEAASARERAALVRGEVARLPEHYRRAVELCHLEGRSVDEAAAALGRPAGTIKVRLARARAMLRARLARRGVTPGVLPVVPPALIQRTVRVAAVDGLRAAGLSGLGAMGPGAVVPLAEGVIAMMGWAKVQGAGVALLSLGVTVAAVGGLTTGGGDGSGEGPADGRGAVVIADPDDGAGIVWLPEESRENSDDPGHAARPRALSDDRIQDNIAELQNQINKYNNDIVMFRQMQDRWEPIIADRLSRIEKLEQQIERITSQEEELDRLRSDRPDEDDRSDRPPAGRRAGPPAEKTAERSPFEVEPIRRSPFEAEPIERSPFDDDNRPDSGPGRDPEAGGDGRQLPEVPEWVLPASPRDREPAEGAPPEYVVEPPDMIRIEVLEALPGRPIAGERLVRPDGRVSLDFYGEVHVDGLTPMEIKEKVVLHLRRILNDESLGLLELDPDTLEYVSVHPRDSDRVFVDVTSYNSKAYYIQGDVVGPGRFHITGRDSVLDAINYAGGLLPTADPENVRLVRPPADGGDGGAEVLPIDWPALVEGGDPSTNHTLKPGDRILVGRKPRPVALFNDRRVEERFLEHDEVRATREAMRNLSELINETSRRVRNPADPALNLLQADRKKYQERYQQLWIELEPILREQVAKEDLERAAAGTPIGGPPASDVEAGTAGRGLREDVRTDESEADRAIRRLEEKLDALLDRIGPPPSGTIEEGEGTTHLEPFRTHGGLGP